MSAAEKEKTINPLSKVKHSYSECAYNEFMLTVRTQFHGHYLRILIKHSHREASSDFDSLQT